MSCITAAIFKLLQDARLDFINGTLRKVDQLIRSRVTRLLCAVKPSKIQHERHTARRPEAGLTSDPSQSVTLPEPNKKTFR